MSAAQDSDECLGTIVAVDSVRGKPTEQRPDPKSLRLTVDLPIEFALLGHGPRVYVGLRDDAPEIVVAGFYSAICGSAAWAAFRRRCLAAGREVVRLDPPRVGETIGLIYREGRGWRPSTRVRDRVYL